MASNRRFRPGVLELLVGSAVVIPFLLEGLGFDALSSHLLSSIFTVGVPIAFALAAIRGVARDGLGPVNGVIGVLAGITLLLGIWSAYGLYAADGGVFFGGLFTAFAAIVLFVAVLAREAFRTYRRTAIPVA